jgi:hypothetical protein
MADNVWLGTTSTAWNVTTNWITGAVPTTGDNVIFDHRAQNDCAAFNASAVTLTSLRITSGFTKLIGTISGAAVTRLQLSATSLVIGETLGDGQIGSGSQLIAIDLGSAQSTIRILNANSTGQSNGFAPILLKGTHASNAISVEGGWVGIGTITLAEAFTFATINITGPSANVELGSGGTLTTINQTDGLCSFRNNLTTLNQESGTAISEGAATITTADVGGTFVANSTGTITTLNVQVNGVADFSQNPTARTVTNTNVYGTGRINSYSGVPKHVTYTNPIALARGAKSSQVEFGPDLSIQQS